jgi:DNA-binding SARP family transcriptional activator/predicted ATPase
MKNIFIKYFGVPEIYVDGNKITVIHKKAEALFYYMIVHQQSTRDELVTLLWSEYDENNGKRSLRNALYQLKKLFGSNIFTTVGNTFVLVNKELDIKTDLSLFLSDDVESLSEIREYIFMHNFNIRSCEEFDTWQSNMRNTYTTIFLEKFESGMNKSMALRNVKKTEYYANRIIGIDIYNEKAFQSLIRLYADKGAYNEAIKLYYKLKNRLEEDLLIEPNKQTRELFEKIVGLKRNVKMNYVLANEDVFYGRIRELLVIKDEYNKFCSGNEYRSIILKGETGIGKTRIIEEFSKEIEGGANKVYYFDFTLLNNKISFGGIIKIAKALEDDLFDNDILRFIRIIEESEEVSIDKLQGLINSYFDAFITKKIIELSQKKRMIFILDNICNIDRESYGLLMNIVEKQVDNKIFFIMSMNNVVGQYIDHDMSELIYNHLVKIIDLKRFSREEVGAFIGLSVKRIENNLPMIDEIYDATDGNPFLLTNIINGLKQNNEYEDLTEANIAYLNKVVSTLGKDEKYVVGIISTFPRGVDFKILLKIANKSDEHIIRIVEALKLKSIIIKKTVKNHVIIFKISLKLLRLHLYENMSFVKKTYIHGHAAKLLEDMYLSNSGNSAYLLELKYHYSNTENRYKYALYKAKYLERRLNYSDEFFPTIKKYDDDDDVQLFIENDKLYKEFEEVKKQIDFLQYKNNVNLEVLQLVFYFIYGRKLIRDGDYDNGILNINNSISLSKKSKNEYYNIHGYLEIIYYAIKISDTSLMNEYVELLTNLDFIDNYEIERGILYRLEGLLNLMLSRYEEAETLMNRSISVFTRNSYVQNNNYLNIAAAYSYIGDIKGLQNDFENAFVYQEKAIEICKENDSVKGLDLFYNKSGQILFLMGRYEDAEKYFIKAFKNYDLLGSFWERSVAESYMAIICHEHNKQADCREHLNRAEIFSKKNSSPHELKILNEAKERIKSDRSNIR